MQNLIAKLTKSEQDQLLKDLNYLNISEIKSFCKKHSIPFSISLELKNGFIKKISENDRKGTILQRIRHFLKTGKILKETCFPPNVVCFEDLPGTLKPSDKLFYGQYAKKNSVMIRLLRELTNGKFKEGAIARIIARDFWADGKAPTFKEFAEKWLEVSRHHKEPKPEWAYLSDKTKRKEIKNWKEFRRKKAQTVLKILNSL